MMLFFNLLLTSLFFCSSTTPVKEEPKKTDEISKVSEAFGHLIGKNIDTLGIKFDLDSVIKGLQDAALGKESPMNEMECIQAISAAQEKAHKELASENLKAAEKFLKENGKNSGVVSLEEGKIQYKIERKGEGNQVEPAYTPVIKYEGKYLDGSVFGGSKEEEIISLEETIPGFTKGLIGMKEGEKRTLYIHPDYGYGTQGILSPNSLLTFEIELVKANAPTNELTVESEKKEDSKVETPSINEAPVLR